MDPKILGELARVYLYRTMVGLIPRIDTSDLVNDGRKRRSVVAELTKLGYLLASTNEFMHVTPKAYDELDASPPDFDVNRAPFDEKEAGFPFTLLPLHQQKFVWEHRKNFRFYIHDTSRRVSLETPTDLITNDVFTSRLSQKTLLVADANYRDARHNALFIQKVQKLKRRHLVWGLVKAKLLTEDEAAVIQMDDVGMESEIAFSQDPTRWESELPVLTERLLTRIRGDQKYYDVLMRLYMQIREYGGWAKFLEAYEKNIGDLLAKSGRV